METPRQPHERIIDVTDYEDEVFYLQLRQLPPELARRCIHEIEEYDLSDEEAVTLIEQKISGRKEAVTETHFNDSRFKEFAEQFDGDFLQHIETELFSDTNQQIGHGNTAKVHELDTQDNFEPVAVKYLVRPQEGTVSARVEHNIVLEVERISTVEKKLSEDKFSTKHIRVPHPYFHHSTDKVQCYGMEKINGINLQTAIDGIISEQLQEQLDQTNLLSIDLLELEKEIETFFESVHSYCLHGSIKPDNMMIDREGRIYIVDFGNSILNSDESASDPTWLAAKQADEVKAAKIAVRSFLESYKQLEPLAA